jgi:hypothetical protein
VDYGPRLRRVSESDETFRHPLPGLAMRKQ